VHEASLAIWIMPAIAVAIGATLWAFGSRLSRHAVMVTGFAAGVPAGAFAAQWLDLPWLPPVLGAILGAFAGLIIARIAYRLMLMATVGIAAALLGAVLSAAVVDSGAVAASGEQMSAAAKQRASELAETVAREMQSSNADQDTREAARDAVERFWNTLDAPERTLVIAATLACGLAGLAFGFFLKSLAEIAATAILGSILIAWGLNEVLGPSGPRLATWSLATLVLAVAGMVVQTLTGARDAKPAAAKSATDAV
jgi:hypothetical protein